MLSFQNPIYIFITIFLIGLIIFLKQNFSISLPFLHTKLLKAGQKKSFSSYCFALLPFVTLFCLSLLLAGPHYVYTESKEQKQARQFVIALDISYSMNADDMEPNRIESAKKTLTKILNQFQGDQVGLVLFAGKPFASIPLTFDINAIKAMIQQYSTETINQQNPSLQGTAIGDAILASLTLLGGSPSFSNQQSADFKSIILITDGSANVGVDPILASKYASNSGITLYTIGIGSEQGGSIPLPSAFGVHRQKVEGVDTKTLSEIAKISGGKFARATNEKEFQDALASIATIKPGNVETISIEKKSPLTNYIIAIVLFLLSVLGFQSRRNYKLLY